MKKIISSISLCFVFLICLVFTGNRNYIEAETTTSDMTSVIIRKYSEGDYSKLLPGATLNLKQIEGTGFQERSFESNSSGEKVELPNGSYILSETKAPQGYGIAEPITFKVENGTVFIKKNEQFIENPYKESGEPYSVTAYNDFNDDGLLTTDVYGKSYYAKNNDGSKQVIYCFNADLSSPPDSYDDGQTIEPDISTMSEVKFNHVKGTDLLKYAINPRTADSEQFLTWIKKVIYKGYKGEQNNIPEGLTATQFRAATQLAIYYFTNSADLDTLQSYNGGKGYHGFQDMNDATLEVTKNLIGYAQNGESASSLPDLDFFVPNNSAYQSLVGTQYHPDSLIDIIRMEDSIAPATHTLTLSKTVSGNAADKEKEFTFNVTLTSPDDTPFSGVVTTEGNNRVGGTVTFDKGSSSLTLKDSENIVFKDLPSSYTYSIQEVGADDYQTSLSVNGGKQQVTKEYTAVLQSEATLDFNNNKDVAPPTGINITSYQYILLILSAILVLLGYLLGKHFLSK